SQSFLDILFLLSWLPPLEAMPSLGGWGGSVTTRAALTIAGRPQPPPPVSVAPGTFEPAVARATPCFDQFVSAESYGRKFSGNFPKTFCRHGRRRVQANVLIGTFQSFRRNGSARREGRMRK